MHGIKTALQRFRSTGGTSATPEKEKRLSDQGGGPPKPTATSQSSTQGGVSGSGQAVQLLPVSGPSVQLLPAGSQPWDNQAPSTNSSETRRSRPVNLAEVHP